MNNKARFTCPYCAAVLEAPEDLRGASIPCPHCREQVEVPLTDTASPAAKVGKKSAAKKTATAPQKKVKSKCPQCGGEIQRGAVFCNHCGWNGEEEAPKTDAAAKQRQTARRVLLAFFGIILLLPMLFGLLVWFYVKHVPTESEPPPLAPRVQADVVKTVEAPHAVDSKEEVDALERDRRIRVLWQHYEHHIRTFQFDAAERMLTELKTLLQDNGRNVFFWRDALPADVRGALHLAEFCPKCLDGLCVKCGGEGHCPECEGDKKCLKCGGKGYTEVVCPDRDCRTCGGSGRCVDCGGTGRKLCTTCKGRGHIFVTETVPCKLCGGDGHYTDGRGNRLQCPQCSGKGHLTRDIPKPCTACGGGGKVPCGTCRGTGRCADCGGRGWKTCEKCDARGMIRKTCSHCSGSGHCPTCGGSGTCPACGGKGSCTHCQGRGLLERKSFPIRREWLPQKPGYLIYRNSPALPLQAEERTGFMTIRYGKRRVHMDIRSRDLWLIRTRSERSNTP